jgi:hypothetical protein
MVDLVVCGGVTSEAVMRARRLIEDASYDPDQLEAMGKAFDDAWARIAPSTSSRRQDVEAARFAVADIVLGQAKHGNFDPQSLADSAARLILSRP